jgi:hypothetical protein
MIESIYHYHGLRTVRIAGRLLVRSGAAWVVAPTSERSALAFIGYHIK